MNPAHYAPVLEAEGALVALKSTHVDAVLLDLLTCVTLTQIYVNQEDCPIEAVYTFSLPLAATLLDLDVRLGQRELRATAVEKQQAEERYEQAIGEGDAAIMLEEVEPGLYSVNVGNLQPGEQAEIRLHFAQVQRFLDDHLRFQLPTTLAPRYGDPYASGLQPHQLPEAVLDSGLRFSLELRISGTLVVSDVQSPTHDITVRKEAGHKQVTLTAETAPMDRDFVLLLTPEVVPQAMAVAAADIHTAKSAHVVLASFLPHMHDIRREPLNLKILVDCSGSMNGDSIAQAREALLRIIDALRPGDLFSITAFGSSRRFLFGRQTAVDGDSIEEARDFASQLQADLGGTELLAALQDVFRLSSPRERRPDVLLITDGEVWGEEDIARRAGRSRHRIFTVGVGASVSEALVRGLAQSSGGACELVTPNEGMADKIVRHFQRMHLPPAREAAVDWSTRPQWQCPKDVSPLFPGDTLAVFAGFGKNAPERGTLRADFGGSGLQQEAIVQSIDKEAWQDLGLAPDTLCRLAARERIRQGLPQKQALQQALDYGLLTPDTNLLLVDVRPEERKSRELPALRVTPHTLAAGWGGAGSVIKFKKGSGPVRYSAPDIMFSYADPSHMQEPDFDTEMEETQLPADFGDDGDWEHLELSDREGDASLEQLIRNLSRRFPNHRPHPPLNLSLDDLQAAGLEDFLAEELRDLLSRGAKESEIVALLLHLLLDRQPYAAMANRSFRRLVDIAWKVAGPRPALEERIKEIVLG